MITGIEYSPDPNNFFVRYNSPRRNFLSYREECNTDAVALKKSYQGLYVLFSTGVDSQVIVKTFLDNKIDAEYIFLNPVGFNSVELNRIYECEKFYGIKVKIVDIDINQYKTDWISRSKLEISSDIFHYSFEWLSSILPENYPIITQGANDPCIAGVNDKVSIYHNYYEGMQRRFRLMSKYRKIIDFPYSPESIASYYTDDTVKGMCASMQYLYENDLQKNGSPILKSAYWNYYGKPIFKGKHFKRDLIWYGKRSGYEEFPNWFGLQEEVKETRVTVPYWDLVDFLENNRNTHRDYNQWIYAENMPGFVSIKSKKEFL